MSSMQARSAFVKKGNWRQKISKTCWQEVNKRVRYKTLRHLTQVGTLKTEQSFAVCGSNIVWSKQISEVNSQANNLEQIKKAQFSNWEFDPGSGRTLAACLIHASRASWIQRSLRGDLLDASGGWVSNTWAICPKDWDTTWKQVLIPDNNMNRMIQVWKAAQAVTLGWARGALASWWGKGLPRQWCVAELRDWSATLGLRHGPNSYGRQQ